MIRCVVLDVDDTVYLERDYVRSGFNAVGAWAEAHLGLSGFAELAWAQFQAGRRGNIFNQVLRALGKPDADDVIASLVRVYREHRPTIQLQPDAQTFIHHARDRFLLGLVTDGPLESQRAKVDALNLRSFIREIVITAELGHQFSKPDPRSFTVIERATGTTGPQCVYIADNPKKDFIGPKKLKWRTIRIRRSLGLHHAFDSAGDVDAEFPDFDRVAEFLSAQ